MEVARVALRALRDRLRDAAADGAVNMLVKQLQDLWGKVGRILPCHDAIIMILG